MDGVNLLPYMTVGDGRRPHERLYWRFGEQSAIREGDWKLLKHAGGTQLFNLAEDIREKNDLAAKRPDKVKDLQAAYNQWNSELANPEWTRAGRRRRR
ncbi:MAG: hypothetical protein ABI882_03210 [Acidobacteriota bacterium]